MIADQNYLHATIEINWPESNAGSRNQWVKHVEASSATKTRNRKGPNELGFLSPTAAHDPPPSDLANKPQRGLQSLSIAIDLRQRKRNAIVQVFLYLQKRF